MNSLAYWLETHLDSDLVEKYESDGFLHLKDVIVEDEITGLRNAVDEQQKQLPTSETGYDFEALARQLWSNQDTIDSGSAQRFDLELYRHMINEDDTARPVFESTNRTMEEDGCFLYEAAGWRKFQEIRRVALDSVIPEICVQLMNSSYLNFWEDTTFVKEPYTRQRTVFHQDYTYFQINGSKCCVVWIPLDRATVETGAMQYIRGSHKWGATFAPNVFIAQTPLLEAQDPKLPDIEANPDKYDIVTVEANPGDIIIHNVMTVHGSHGNITSEDTRRAISFRYCGDDITYFDRPGAIPQPYINNTIPNGAPLYSKNYPLVWPKPAPGMKISHLFDGLSSAA